MSIPATVHRANGAAIPVTVRNLSGGGAFVIVPTDRTNLRGLLELELKLPGAEPQWFLWRAYVVHRQPTGVGVLFDDRQFAERLPLLSAQRAVRHLTAVPSWSDAAA